MIEEYKNQYFTSSSIKEKKLSFFFIKELLWIHNSDITNYSEHLDFLITHFLSGDVKEWDTFSRLRLGEDLLRLSPIRQFQPNNIKQIVITEFQAMLQNPLTISKQTWPFSDSYPELKNISKEDYLRNRLLRSIHSN